MAKNSQQPQVTQQQTKVDLAPEQRQLLDLAMPSLREFAASTPKTPEGSQVADFNPTQASAQKQALDAAGAQTLLSQAAGRTQGTLTDGSLMRADSNPYLGGYIDAATRPMAENLTQNILPQLRSEMINAGQFGSSNTKHQALAAGKTQQAIGDTSGRIAMDAYGRGLDAMKTGLALAPQTTALQTAGAATTGLVGDTLQAHDQALKDEATQKFWYEQMFPLYKGSTLAGMTAQIPGAGATTVATGPAPPKPNPVLAGLGGGLAGASAGASFGPWGALIGGVGGAGLGFFGSRA